MDKENDASGYHYLVVDDDTFTTSLISSMLRRTGAAKVDIAENGRDALEYLNASKLPDIIISDLSMPQLDGVAYMRHLANHKFGGGIIFISSSGKRILRMVANLAAEHKLNVLGTLSKPFTPLALQGMISHFKGMQEISSRLPPSLVTPEALRTAIEKNQLVPYFQPKVAIATGIVIGAEVLARWMHPEQGIVPPSLFIPVAEKNGLIDILTQDIFEKTLQQAVIWRKNAMPIDFAINFSALSLADITLPDRLEAQLLQHGLTSSDLTLEVTESCFLEHITSSLETMLRLHLKGFHLSIDDFGTGHSSLEELHKIPFSELKIDRVFVNGAAHHEEAQLFLQSAITLAKKLNLSIVAEGVEQQEDWDLCARLGVDIIQGYLIARPMSASDFQNWYHTRQSQLPQVKIQN